MALYAVVVNELDEHDSGRHVRLTGHDLDLERQERSMSDLA